MDQETIFRFDSTVFFANVGLEVFNGLRRFRKKPLTSSITTGKMSGSVKYGELDDF